MNEDDYIVVYEYDESMGGTFGVRVWTTYPNREDFDKLSLRDSGRFVIAEGVSESEALDLCALTPEVCRMTHAIELAFADRTELSFDDLKSYLDDALSAVAYSRSRVSEHGLKRPSAQKYLDALRETIEANPTTLKALALSRILETANDLGEIT